jgi:hypothetical protein
MNSITDQGTALALEGNLLHGMTELVAILQERSGEVGIDG